jgi:phosphotransferase system enzyme I (PtsP)
MAQNFLNVQFLHAVNASQKISGVLFRARAVQEAGKNNQILFEDLLDKVREKIILKNSDICDVLLQMTHDPSWIEAMTRGFHEGKTLKASIEDGIVFLKLKSEKMIGSPFFEKIREFEILSQKLLDVLSAYKVIYPQTPFILLIEKPSPLDLLDPPEDLLVGVVAREVAEGSHTNILAKQMDIPLILVKQGWESLEEGKWANITHTKFFLSQEKEVVPQIPEQGDLSKSKTKDGSSISLFFNAAFEKDLEFLKTPFVKGVGLFRTEMPFLKQDEFPSTQDQQTFYTKIFEKAKGAPIAFRIMDIGGDKIPSYFPNFLEDNPLLGWRSIRISLDRPLIFKHQIRALLRAGAGKSLYILFPLLTESAEFYPLQDLLNAEIDRERELGHELPLKIKKGVMIEVPSFAWHFEAIAKDIDFASVGTNDLFQFFFGVDRMNPHLSKRYDVLSPIFLSFLKHISDVAKENYKTLSVCGEMASKPIEALALLGLGYKTLSCTPQSLKSIAAMISSLDLKSFRAYLTPLLSSKDHSLREHLKAWAQDHRIDLGE